MLAACLVVAGIYLSSRRLPKKSTFTNVHQECLRWFREELRRQPSRDAVECLELLRSCVKLRIAHCVDVISTAVPEPRESFCSPNELMYVITKCALVFAHPTIEDAAAPSRGRDPVLVLRNKGDLFSLYYVEGDACFVVKKQDAGTIWSTLTRVLHPAGTGKRKSAAPQALYALLLQKHAEDA